MAREIGEYIDELVKSEGEPQNLREAFNLVARANGNLMFDRHKKYGPNNIRKFGMYGVVIRATDKLERLTTMVFGTNPEKGLEAIKGFVDEHRSQLRKDGTTPTGLIGKTFDFLEAIVNPKDTTNESVEDTLGDLSNYGTIGLLVNRGWWELPYLEEEPVEPEQELYPVDDFGSVKAATGTLSANEQDQLRIDNAVNNLAGTGTRVNQRTEQYINSGIRKSTQPVVIPEVAAGALRNLAATRLNPRQKESD